MIYHLISIFFCALTAKKRKSNRRWGVRRCYSYRTAYAEKGRESGGHSWYMEYIHSVL